VYVHGGVFMDPYINRLEKLGTKKIELLDTYLASEGYFAYQTSPNRKGMKLLLNCGIFYEFIPFNSDYFDENGKLIDNHNALTISQVQEGVDYAMAISTNAGLWRYLIGDTIRFTSLNPYRIKVTGRTKHHINVFGEELMVENTDTALTKTCKAFHCEMIDYTVAPIFMKDKEKGAHEWIIEFKNPPEDIAKFSQVLDENIQAVNSDYEAKRYNNMTLNPLVLNVARENLFYDWLKQQDKLGGQHKVPRLSNERTYLESLLKL
jgi:hypothetical protein